MFKLYIEKNISSKELLKKVFNEYEIKADIIYNEEKRIIKTPEDFTIIWVKKESYVKYLSIGLTYGLKNVDTLKPYNFIIKKIDNYYISVYLGEMIDVSEV